FLLHIWLGCCSHHAHASEPTSSCASTPHTCHSHGCHGSHQHGSHQHRGQQSSHKGPSKNCPGKRCEGTQCEIASSAKVSLNKAWFSSAALLAVLPPASSPSPQWLYQSAIGLDLAPLPAVRTHLLYQLLLN